MGKGSLDLTKFTTVVIKRRDLDEIKRFCKEQKIRPHTLITMLLDQHFNSIVNTMQNYEQFKEFLKDEGYTVEHDVSYVNKGEKDE